MPSVLLALLLSRLSDAWAQPAPDADAVAPAVVALGGVRLVVIDEDGLEVPSDSLAVTLERAGFDPVPLRADGGALVSSPIAPGPWRVAVHGPGLADGATEVVVPEGRYVELTMSVALQASSTVVVVAPTEAEELRRSAEAALVVETDRAQQQSADLGEVLARTQGVGVRRSGGLGSAARFSLAGLTDDQVRFFLDGVPLDRVGYPFGVSNVPVGLVERVEIYRGVVPVRFGADALGGAVNLVSEDAQPRSGGAVSYQGGSFDTHRLSAQGRHVDPSSGVRVAGSGYLDAARNDYPVDVEVADASGRLSTATVRRFHDQYLAGGGALEVGVAHKPWAEALSLRAFGAAFRQEIQHNVVMTVPYGEPVSRLQTAGALARYRHAPAPGLWIEGLASYAWTRRAFTDTGACVYDWFGQCIRERAVPGEISTPARDQVVRDHTLDARARVAWRPHPSHTLEVVVSPSWFTRTGEDLLHEGQARDPLTAQRSATQVVTGLEHTARSRTDRVENRLFVKHYAQGVASEEPGVDGSLREATRATHRVGLGDGLRVNLGRSAWIKASYEWATRLPTPEEIFGDAVLVLDNPELRPETSHNVNVGVTARLERDPVGVLDVDIQAFGRFARDLIVLLGNDRTFTWFNVFGARSLGVEAAVAWTSPGDWVALEGDATWLDLRNTSDEGTFGDFEGDRIPNRPWLTANGSVRVGASRVAAEGDRLTLDWYARYVHPFYRGWESVGLVAFKHEVPAQFSHTVALTYAVDAGRARVSASVEVQNITDADLFDFFGVQRPGRAVFGKVTTSW